MFANWRRSASRKASLGKIFRGLYGCARLKIANATGQFKTQLEADSKVPHNVSTRVISCLKIVTWVWNLWSDINSSHDLLNAVMLEWFLLFLMIWRNSFKRIWRPSKLAVCSLLPNRPGNSLTSLGNACYRMDILTNWGDPPRRLWMIALYGNWSNEQS